MDKTTNSKQLAAWNAAAKKIAGEILDLVKSSNHILLHCHPSPDPDSLGSTLAMKMVLENMGKKVTAIAGDSKLPQAFSHMPGFDTVIAKNFFEIDLSQFDLFIAEDSGSPEMVSKIAPVTFPESLKVVVIDHHLSNPCYGNINLVVPSLPANCALLALLFREWKAPINVDIARCLFWGIYSDTGGFKYSGISELVFEAVHFLSSIEPDICKKFSADILTMETSSTLGFILLTGAGLRREAISIYDLNSAKVGNIRLAISLITNETLKDIKELKEDDLTTHAIGDALRSVKDFDISVVVIEKEPGKCNLSFRSKKSNLDVSIIAKSLGGGGHRSAAGAQVITPSDSIREKIKSAVESYLCKD